MRVIRPISLALAYIFSLASAAWAAPPPLTPAQQRRVTPIVDVVRQQLDAVVNVSATHIVTEGGDDTFEQPREMRENSVGSGAVIHPAGYVLTNAHVVARASELTVIFADGHKLPAELVATLPEEDVAIIKVAPPAPLQAITLGRSDDLMVGETVVAIGNPVGLEHSVTSGIISAVGREMKASGGVSFKDIIQTDAAINPGNSGGPLLNILGAQIGVNTAIRTDAQNVGFAIPIDRVRALLPRLLAVEAKSRVRLGLGLGAEVTAPIAGVTIATVEKGSPAATIPRARLMPSTRGRTEKSTRSPGSKPRSMRPASRSRPSRSPSFPRSRSRSTSRPRPRSSGSSTRSWLCSSN